MDSARKRSASSASGSGDPQPPPKAVRPARAAGARPMWCVRCWARPADGCTGDHRILSVKGAHQEAAVALADTQRALKLCQTRLDTVLGACEPIMLMAQIEWQEDSENYCTLEGGWLTIRICSIDGVLTDEEKEAVTVALEAGELECEWSEHGPEDGVVAAHGSLDIARMAKVLPKLPRCVEGQKLHIGSIVYFSKAQGDFYIYDKAAFINKSDLRRGARILGRVTQGVDVLRVSANLDSDDSIYREMDVIYGNPMTTQLKSVKFVESKAHA
ncbi:uncharacterized protein LOC127748587 [Frankliniella occidentalis]|uniref:Uncharacterized protein LOC127748587 n=1 Tax=Frankliniella occidentalis TaxID=133901 RepID=A0A9C6TV03_FRAOC|nr:uncharacterized protein LOC127748587 [Frankliniella occidentalis]